MPKVNNNKSTKSMILISKLLAAFVFISGAIVVLEWILNSFKISIINHLYFPMAPATALSVIILSLNIFFDTIKTNKYISYFCRSALFLGIIFNLIICIEFAAKYFQLFNLDIENFIFLLIQTEKETVVRKMSPITALILFIFFLSILIADPKKAKFKIRNFSVQITVLIIFIFSCIYAVSYLYKVPMFYNMNPRPIALYTLLTIIPACISFLLNGNEALLFRWIKSKSVFSRFTRNTIPVFIVLILLHGWINTIILSHAHSSMHFLTTALTALTTTLLIILITISVANIIQKTIISAEQALRESEKRYRNVVEDQIDTICRFLPDGTFTFVNDVYCKFFGKTKEKLIGYKWQPLVYPEDLHIIEKKLKTLSPSNKVVVIENRIYSASGNIHWMQFVNRAFYDINGNLKEIQSVGRDINTLKQTEESLKESEERYRLLFTNSLDAVMLTVPDGRILEANPAASKIFGFSEEEIVSIGSNGILDNKDPRLIPALEERKRTGKIKGELTFLRKDGTKFQGEISSQVFKDRSGEEKTSMVIRDITERKKAEEEKLTNEKMLQRYQRLASLGELSASIAHEIRQPLQVIKVITDSIIYWHDNKKELSEGYTANIDKLQKISNSADKINQIIKNLYDMIKKPTNSVSNEININNEINRIIVFFEQKFKSNSIKLNLELDQNIKTVFFPEIQFQVVLSNLLNNAIDAHKTNKNENKNKMLIIKTSGNENFITMEVQDNALGIKDNKEKIFDPLFTTKMNDESMGLGLFIVNNILVTNNSMIDANDNDLGGASFKVTFKTLKGE